MNCDLVQIIWNSHPIDDRRPARNSLEIVAAGFIDPTERLEINKNVAFYSPNINHNFTTSSGFIKVELFSPIALSYSSVRIGSVNNHTDLVHENLSAKDYWSNDSMFEIQFFFKSSRLASSLGGPTNCWLAKIVIQILLTFANTFFISRLSIGWVFKLKCDSHYMNEKQFKRTVLRKLFPNDSKRKRRDPSKSSKVNFKKSERLNFGLKNPLSLTSFKSVI